MNQPSQTITAEQVRHVAKLSRLDLDDEQVQQFSEQLTKVLEHIAKLNRLDVRDVQPMAHALDLSDVTRDDTEQPGLPVERALANAPEQSPPFFRVPKVIGEESGA